MNECPICLGNIKENHTTECGHHFCHQCIFEWLKKHDSCPLCRQMISIVQDNHKDVHNDSNFTIDFTNNENDSKIFIYAHTFNFLRIMDGVAGLRYSC